MTEPTGGDLSPVDRLIAALQDPDHLFTSEQVAYLMATAARWGREAVEGEPSPETYAAGYADGYRAHAAEENAGWPPPAVFDAASVTGWVDRRAYRRRFDRDARRRRRTDHRKGPVPVWPATTDPDWSDR